MAQTNQVSCLVQVNRIDEAITRCERVVLEHPEMKHARSLLQGLHRIQPESDQPNHDAPAGLLGQDVQSVDDE